MGNIIRSGNYSVYVHTSPSGKMYVGQTSKTPEERWGKGGSRYLNKRKDKYVHPAFANAILKYGWENFDHDIIASNLTKEEADNFEKILIEKLDTMNPDNGYNCKEGGAGGSFSNETLKRMSESHKGIKQSEETIRKRTDKLKGENNPNYGKHLSEETRGKISEALKGNTLPDETKRKISVSLKGKRIGAERFGSKRVVQYDMQGNLIKIWDSIADAGRELKVDKSNIAKCCNDENDDCRTAGGYIWRFFGDELTKEHILHCNNRKDEKCVGQYSLSGELIDVFKSTHEAELKTGVYHGNISYCCLGKRKTAGGFIWKYYNDRDIKIAI